MWKIYYYFRVHSNLSTLIRETEIYTDFISEEKGDLIPKAYPITLQDSLFLVNFIIQFLLIFKKNLTKIEKICRHWC